MVNAQRKALERLWKDRCTVYHRVKVTDPKTKLTDFDEKPLLQDQPCKLSFETLNSTDGDHVATVAQSVKLFISPDVEIPAGCKIVVTRFNDLERTFTYSRSGEPGIFTNHQEIMLEPFKGYA
ncbi:MAG: hypothetical protein UEJ46_07505 [Eggerthellaceae bacterium]|mgnify:FL=1|jgi:hypothetical protein|nr:hypothetical protein [Eggerthellaceae bacterium]DAZ23436.1 MAG TPA: head closure knob [Caudoviricetes sp.]